MEAVNFILDETSKTYGEPKTRHCILKDMFDECMNTTEAARNLSDQDTDYYHGTQWTSAELAELRKRRQPPVTMNVIRDKIESICGVEEQSDTSPKAWPRTPNDEQAAEVATDTLRYVCDIERFDKTRIDILRDMLVSGTGGAIVEVQQNAQKTFDIKIRKLRWETLIYDPYSRETDFSDARYLGCAQWMNADDVIALYGEDSREAVESVFDVSNLNANGESYQDRPNTNVWADPKRRRVMVVELYYREAGVWRRAIFTGGGVIADGDSPYMDENGRASCPIELASAYVDRDNNRYGVVRGMISAQDEINHRRSKMLHLLNTRQTYRKEGTIASTDPQALRRELNKPDGDIVLARTAEWGKDIGIIQTDSEVAGQAELLNDARMFIDKQGANNAMMGRGTENQSGRAILAQQQAGMQTLATIFSGYNDLILRLYRQVWARARQFWQSPMWVRVTDDIGAPKFIQVNDPIVDEIGNPIIDPRTGQPAMQNRLAEMGVDLIVDRVSASANMQDETFKEVVRLVRESGMGASPEVINAIVSSSGLRPKVKKQLMEAFENKQPDPMIAAKGQSEIAKEQAQAQDAAASAAKKQAETMAINIENQLALMSAQIKTLQVQQAMQMQHPQIMPQPMPMQPMPPQMMQPEPQQWPPMEQPQEPPNPMQLT